MERTNFKPMKSIVHSLAIIFCGLVTAEAKLNVVATTADLGAIAREIGGNEVLLTLIAKPTEDPHFVDAKPSFIVKLNKADALIEGGAELEAGWLRPLLEGARNSKLNPGGAGRIACSQGIKLLEIPASLDRSQGDIHAAGNPHYLMDPANAKIVAQRICDAFCALDAKSSATYRENLKVFTGRLDEKMEAWKERMIPAHGQRIVAYHNTWPYFSKAFGVKVDLFLEPKPGIPPTPSHLAQVIAEMKKEKIRAVIVEPHQNRRTAEKVAQETGAKVLPLCQFPGGVKGTESGYIAMMDLAVTLLSQALNPASN